MVEATAATTKQNFKEFAENLEEVKAAATTEVVQVLPIDAEQKDTILVSVEENIKKLLLKLAKKQEIGWVESNPEDYAHLPNSITGVIVYYILKGIKDELGYEFEKQPKSLTYNLSKHDRKVAGKKRLLTRDQKNQLIAKTQMGYYEDKMKSGEMDINAAMFAIKDAYERIQNFKEIGYILPEQKTAYPHWADEAGEEAKGED